MDNESEKIKTPRSRGGEGMNKIETKEHYNLWRNVYVVWYTGVMSMSQIKVSPLTFLG